MDLIAGAQLIDITGFSEISIHPDFKDLLELFRITNKRFQFSTNGSNLTKTICDILAKCNIEYINISLNTLIEKRYKTIHNTDVKLSKIIDSILYLRSKTNARLVLSFVLTSHNFDEVTSFINFAKEHKFEITLFDLTPTITYPAGLIVEDNPQNRKIVEAVRTLIDDGTGNTGLRGSIFKFENRVTSGNNQINKEVVQKMNITNCKWVYDSIFIRWDGVVTPCCWCLEDMGNITKNTLTEIWNGPAYTELRDCISRNDLKHCMNCRRAG